MDVQKCLAGFSYCEKKFPYESVEYVLQNKHEMIPHLLNIIRNVLQNYEKNLFDWDHIFALYLLAQLRYKPAFPYIIQLAKLPGDILDDLLGDVVTEGLSRFMISTFENDIDSIKALIEDESVWESSRAAGINALLGLVISGYITRDDLIVYFSKLLQSSLMDNEECADTLVYALAVLWPKDLYNDIALYLNQEGGIILLSEFNNMIAMGKEACLKRYLYDYSYNYPIKDTVHELQSYPYFSEDTEDADVFYTHELCDEDDCLVNFMFSLSYQVVRDKPKIGRNDMCSCNSGKKYKKCCLISNLPERKNLIINKN